MCARLVAHAARLQRPHGSVHLAVLILVMVAWSAAGVAQESVCYGTTANGRLENGVQLPIAGKNFKPYSGVLAGLGRTHVHSRVRSVVVDAYAALEKTQPGRIFVYGETGWATGGRIKPHQTHQNGLSVDFMVPVVDQKGASVALPTGPLNKYGYGIEFDARGQSPADGLRIDFEALAADILTKERIENIKQYYLPDDLTLLRRDFPSSFSRSLIN